MSSTVFGMVSSYGGLNQTDWLWKQSPEPFGVWKNIQLIANHPSPDAMLLYQFDFPRQQRGALKSWRDRILRKKPSSPVDLAVTLRQVPPTKRLYLMREPPLDEVVPTNKRNYRLASQHCAYVSGPDELAPVPDYMPAIWYVNVPFTDLAQQPPPPKPSACSWVTSGISRTQNHRDRLAFLRQLRQSSVTFDLYGRGLPDWSHPRGTLRNKWHGLAPYRYNLAIENYADNDWYVSEKLWDALLSWCLPIYYGGPAADRLLPPGSFLRLPSMDERGIAFIQETIASPDAWYEAKDAIAEARQIILHELNLLNWLSNYDKKHWGNAA